MRTLQVSGAYGRMATRRDWDEGKDFRVLPFGPYFSIRDVPMLKRDGINTIEFYDIKGNLLFLVNL